MTKLEITYLVKLLQNRKDDVQFSLANLQERIDKLIEELKNEK